MTIDQGILYAKCPCGSGKKFKFCCFPKCRDSIDADTTLSEIAGMVRATEAHLDELMPNDEANAFCDRGVEALRKGDYARAAELLRRAREADETLWTAWNNEAMCAWEAGDIEAAYGIQRRGVEKSPIGNTFGHASMVFYSYALGREDEAAAWLEKAVSNKKPLDATVALHVCKALAVFRRHRDIVDYATASGMADDADVAYYLGTAYANLGETGLALSALHGAQNGCYYRQASAYIDMLEVAIEPPSPYAGDWPYFSTMDFAPARWLDEDMDGRGDPLARCLNFADEAVVVLCAEGRRPTEDLLKLVAGRGGVRFDKLREGLEELVNLECVDDDEEDEEDVGESLEVPAKAGFAIHDADFDAEDRRFPMRTRFNAIKERNRLQDVDLDLLYEAMQLIKECKDEPSDKFLMLENGLARLDDEQRNSFLVKSAYLEMVHAHDPERAIGMLRNFYATCKDDAFVAGTLLSWLRDGDDHIDEAIEIADRFRVPVAEDFTGETGVMMFTRWIAPLLVLSKSQTVTERHPEKMAHIRTMVNACRLILQHYSGTHAKSERGKRARRE